MSVPISVAGDGGLHGRARYYALQDIRMEALFSSEPFDGQVGRAALFSPNTHTKFRSIVIFLLVHVGHECC
jgi:hypothetical protein